jgi:hypothetical protein
LPTDGRVQRRSTIAGAAAAATAATAATGTATGVAAAAAGATALVAAAWVAVGGRQTWSVAARRWHPGRGWLSCGGAHGGGAGDGAADARQARQQRRGRGQLRAPRELPVAHAGRAPIERVLRRSRGVQGGQEGSGAPRPWCRCR